MSLASNYAKLISDGADIEKTLVYMKSRGHLSLLPQILRIASRASVSKNTPTILLAKESDAKKYAEDIKKALSILGANTRETNTVLDARAVGGYAVRTPSATIDRTFRTALVSLYKQTIHNH